MRHGRRSWRRLTSAAAAGALLWGATLVPSGNSVLAKPGFQFSRFAGQDRYDTAKRVATGSFTTAADVVIATGLNFPDALAGNYLAGTRHAPLLLTAPGSVPAVTKDALSALKTKNVTLLGLTSAIGQAVEDDLRATDSTADGGGKLTVTRVGGGNRFQTAQRVAEGPGAGVVGKYQDKATAIVASGNTFPDALAAGGLSYAMHFPTLLTAPDSLSPEASAAMDALGIKHVFMMGGSAAVATAVDAQIQAKGITVQRVAGVDRQDTAAQLARLEINTFGFKDSHVNLATGAAFADALVLGPHAGREDPTVVAFTPVANSSTNRLLRDLAPTAVDGHVAGGTVAVSQAEEDAASAILATNGNTNLVALQASVRNGGSAGLDAGDVWFVLFSKLARADTGDTIRVRDAGGETATIALGVGNSFTTTDAGGQRLLEITFSLPPTVADSDASTANNNGAIDYDASSGGEKGAEIVAQTGINDADGNDWNVAASPDHILNPDGAGPFVVADDGDAGDTAFTITFNEAIDRGDAGDTSRYTVRNGTTNDPVTKAEVSSSSQASSSGDPRAQAWTTVLLTVQNALGTNATLDTTVADVAGNRSSQTGYVLTSGAATPTGKAPTISANPPPNHFTNDRTPTINGNAADSDGKVVQVLRSLDGGPFTADDVTCISCGSSSTPFSWTPSQDLSVELHTVVFEAVDDAGNRGRVEVSFGIDVTPPHLVSATPLPDLSGVLVTYDEWVFCTGRGADNDGPLAAAGYQYTTGENVPVGSPATNVAQQGNNPPTSSQCRVSISGGVSNDASHWIFYDPNRVAITSRVRDPAGNDAQAASAPVKP